MNDEIVDMCMLLDYENRPGIGIGRLAQKHLLLFFATAIWHGISEAQQESNLFLFLSTC